MKSILAGYIGMSLGLLVASKWANLLSFDDYKALLLFALVLLLLDRICKPIISLICLPVNIVTLGLFSLVINTGMIYFANVLYAGLKLQGFGSTFFAALIISVFRIISKRLFAH